MRISHNTSVFFISTGGLLVVLLVGVWILAVLR